MKKSIWVIGNEQSDAANVIKSTDGGWVNNYWEEEGIIDGFEQIFEAFATKSLPIPHSVEEYTRENQAKKYAQILSSFVKS